MDRMGSEVGLVWWDGSPLEHPHAYTMAHATLIDVQFISSRVNFRSLPPNWFLLLVPLF